MNDRLTEEQYFTIQKELKESKFIIICSDHILYFYGSKLDLLAGIFVIYDNFKEL